HDAVVDLEFDRDFFAARVRGHDRFGDLPRVRCRSCNSQRARADAAFHVFHRHGDTDAASRTDENVALINRERFGCETRHSARIRFMHCTAWPLAPLTMLSIALMTTRRFVRLSIFQAMSMKFVPTTFFVSGSRESPSKRTNGSSPYAPLKSTAGSTATTSPAIPA